MLTWLLDEHHLLPGVWYSLPAGEKQVVWAIFDRLMRERRERMR